MLKLFKQKTKKGMRKSLILSLVLAGILASCSGKKYVNVPKGIYDDFSLQEYESFDFYELKGPDERGAYYEENIEYLQGAITKKMEERGLKRNTSNPDLKVNLGIKVQEQVQTRETNLATDPFMYTGQRSYTWTRTEVPVNTYTEGSLTMHLVDVSDNEAVWVGTIDRALPKKQKNVPSTIQNAVDLLFLKIDK